MPSITIQFRRDTAANWTSADPTLLAGELGFETDTRKMKIGDGSTAWTALDYVTAEAAGAVLEADYDAHTILAATTDDTPVTLEVTEQTVVGRITGGNIAALSVAQLQTLLFSAALPENVAIKWDAALSADGKYDGLVIDGTAGTNLAFGEVVYFSSADSKWEKTDASAEATTKPLCGIVVVAGNEDATVTIMLWGFIREDDWAWTTPGAPLFIDEDTAGALNETAPAGSGECIRIAAYVIDSNSIFFHPENAWDELA
jgi:hypothetical protein